MEEDGPTASMIFVVFLLIHMFYYGFSTAMEYVNEKEVERKAEEDGDKTSMKLLRLLNHYKEQRNIADLIMVLAHVMIGYFCMGGWISELQKLLEKMTDHFSWNVSAEVNRTVSFAAVSVLLLFVILVLGFLVPRKLAKTHPEKWAYRGAAIIHAVFVILHPFSWFVDKSGYVLLMLFGINGEASDSDVTEEEIIDMVNEGQEQGIIEAAEAEMISNIFEYREKEAQDIMTNRNNIIALDGSMLLKDAIDEVLSGKQSRYPVYEETVDHVIGILHLKDAMRYHADHDKLHSPLRTITDLLREPVFIPLTKNIDELFKQMQSEKLQMVIVIDEYGQTAGLVAMEDILEEIVGNIMDEYDEEDEYIEDKGNDEYIIEGKTPLEELEERFDISFGEVEFETLNGFLISKMDKIPDEDEQFEIAVDHYHFKILTVENKMIHSVLVTRIPEEEKSETALEDKEQLR